MPVKVKKQKTQSSIISPSTVKTKGPKTKRVGGGLSAPLFDINGRSQGTIALPKEIFGVKPNKQLLSQAIRVYSFNRSTHLASVKTRAEVRGGGKKPWRQKGTGKARAGSIRSPLWVGGGIIFGPKPRKVKLSLPQKMRRKALILALSQKRKEGTIKVISNFDKMEPKTKTASTLLKKLSVSGQTLLILKDSKPNVRLAVRNIPKVEVSPISDLNAFQVLASRQLLFSKEAIENFKN